MPPRRAVVWPRLGRNGIIEVVEHAVSVLQGRNDDQDNAPPVPLLHLRGAAWQVGREHELAMVEESLRRSLRWVRRLRLAACGTETATQKHLKTRSTSCSTGYACPQVRA